MPPLPKAVSKAVYDRDDWHCRHCNCQSNLTPHHVVYQSASGTDELNNLLTLCIKCHNDVHERRLIIYVVKKLERDLVVHFSKTKGWKP